MDIRQKIDLARAIARFASNREWALSKVKAGDREGARFWGGQCREDWKIITAWLSETSPTTPERRTDLLSIKEGEAHYTVILQGVDLNRKNHYTKGFQGQVQVDTLGKQQAEMVSAIFLEQVVSCWSAEPGLARLKNAATELHGAIKGINDAKVLSKVGKWCLAHGATLLRANPHASKLRTAILPVCLPPAVA